MRSFVAVALASAAVTADDAWITDPYYTEVDYAGTLQGMEWQDYDTCMQGTAQSPIDFSTANGLVADTAADFILGYSSYGVYDIVDGYNWDEEDSTSRIPFTTNYAADKPNYVFHADLAEV